MSFEILYQLPEEKVKSSLIFQHKIGTKTLVVCRVKGPNDTVVVRAFPRANDRVTYQVDRRVNNNHLLYCGREWDYNKAIEWAKAIVTGGL